MHVSSSPLMQAYFFFQEVAEEGFDWDSPFAAAKKVKEELEEVLEELRKPSTPLQQQALKEEIGDLFLACSCLARHCQVEPDEAIDLGLKKFKNRYIRFKSYAKEKGISFQEASPTELSTLWQQLKEEFARED
jgi:uncharacterized protein YabN with tetrapyrrole methylase and pyrophosphatase domain